MIRRFRPARVVVSPAHGLGWLCRVKEADVSSLISLRVRGLRVRKLTKELGKRQS